MKKAILLLVTILFLVPAADLFGGTIFLKNGHVVTGKVIASDEEKVIVTWDNGRATIYLRFVENVVLDSAEEESLARRVEAQVINLKRQVNQDIELPDLGELLGEDEQEPTVAVEMDIVSDTEADQVLTEAESVSTSETSVSEVAFLQAEEEVFLPSFTRTELPGLGLFVDVPRGWESVSATGAARVISEDGSVMIAVDRYSRSDVVPEEAAVILGERLKKAGFVSKSGGRSALLSVLHPAFINESLSPTGANDCLHGLISGEDGVLLVSVYTAIEMNSEVDGLIASILASLASPIAAR
ncbi:MAG: hypothetical protein AAEJ04_06280 [Planctomycetota bacterium]